MKKNRNEFNRLAERNRWASGSGNRLLLSLTSFLLGGLLALSTVATVSAVSVGAQEQVGNQEQAGEQVDSKGAGETISADHSEGVLSDSRGADADESDSKPSESSGPTSETEPFYTDVGSRPDWVKKGSYLSGDPIEEYVVVMSEKRLRELDAEEELEKRLVETVHERLDKWFAAGAGKAIGVDLAYIRKHLIQRHPKCDANGAYHQLVHWTVPSDSLEMVGSDKGDAFQYIAQVKLDSAFKTWAGEQWENRVVVSRTMQTGLLAASIILALGLAFSYFSINHKTRGFYSGRLQTVGLVGLLVIGAAAWWFATRFVWL